MSAAQVYGVDIGYMVGGMFGVWLVVMMTVWLSLAVMNLFSGRN